MITFSKSCKLLMFVFIIGIFGAVQSVKAQWNSQESGTSEHLTSVYFHNNSLGWAVSSFDSLLKTENGGDTWSIQSSGTLEAFSSVHFADEKNGWVVGANGTILHSSDSGTTWSMQSSDTSVNLSSVYATGSSTGFAVGNNGVLLSTTDSGNTWSIQSNGTSVDLNSVYFTDANTGWVVGGDGVILHTTNGGSSWQTQNSGVSESLNSVYFVDASTGWAVGSNGTILKTEDGGGTWQSQTQRSNGISSVHFTGTSNGWIVAGGNVLHTKDGGNTWFEQETNTFFGVSSVHFPNDSAGWLVGAYGTVLHTENGGCNPSNVNVTVNQDGDSLIADASDASYQWLSCDNGYTVLSGETSQSYNPSSTNSDYAVEVIQNGCRDTSSCHSVVSGILKNTLESTIKVYPNPTDGKIMVDLGKVYKQIQIQIENTSGRLILEKQMKRAKVFDLTFEGNSGIYVLTLQTSSGNIARVRLLKQ